MPPIKCCCHYGWLGPRNPRSAKQAETVDFHGKEIMAHIWDYFPKIPTVSKITHQNQECSLIYAPLKCWLEKERKKKELSLAGLLKALLLYHMLSVIAIHLMQFLWLKTEFLNKCLDKRSNSLYIQAATPLLSRWWEKNNGRALIILFGSMKPKQ